ncbi:MAG: RNA polymerase sigma-54 factor, partial [Alphaproteobacteria bacterium]|nr:RNA polymerase sigma-54 factor [Alphaproteobacteria bacterium]
MGQSFGQSLQLKQKQSMVMTPRLQQAIRMLQMTNLDLNSYLEDQALENPFLEV